MTFAFCNRHESEDSPRFNKLCEKKAKIKEIQSIIIRFCTVKTQTKTRKFHEKANIAFEQMSISDVAREMVFVCGPVITAARTARCVMEQKR